MDKLTLNIDEEVIKKAKMLAEENKTSVSRMFTNFIDALSAKQEDKKRHLAPLTKKASGIVKLNTEVDYKQLISDTLIEKYGYGK